MKSTMYVEFNCPECGGHTFGSTIKPGSDIYERVCHGGRRQQGSMQPCSFSFPHTEDYKYFVVMRREEFESRVEYVTWDAEYRKSQSGQGVVDTRPRPKSNKIDGVELVPGEPVSFVNMDVLKPTAEQLQANSSQNIGVQNLLHLTRQGVYKHYAGHLYFALFTARHTETNEELVIYLPLYAHQNGGIVPQARPAGMWKGDVVLAATDGEPKRCVPRFKFLGETLAPATDITSPGPVNMGDDDNRGM